MNAFFIAYRDLFEFDTYTTGNLEDNRAELVIHWLAWGNASDSSVNF